MTYDEARRYIEYTDGLGSVLGLENIQELLRRLGSPQEDIKVVHIAGTNGKGSICAFLDDILEDAGYTVGRYISPTIFTYLERFQINKEYMAESDFAGYLELVKAVADDMVRDGFHRPTSFETETALAFCYFRDKKVDFLLLETGMGGLEDATNVCTQPVCTIIASISMDHMRFLGDNLKDIYMQKLGILKDGVPCVSYPVQEELMSLWVQKYDEKRCSEASTMINSSDIDIQYCGLDGSVFTYKGEKFELAVPGIYQIYNSVTAIETAYTLQKLGFALNKVNVFSGVKKTYWKGRFQRIMEEPMVYVDGAHNPGGWKALRKNIDEYFAGRRLIYVCGVFKDKDYRQMLEIMMPDASDFIAVQPDNPRALDKKELAELAKTYIDSVFVADDVDGAVEQAIDIAGTGENTVIIIFGSLSFIGPIIDKAEKGGYTLLKSANMSRIDKIMDNPGFRKLMSTIKEKERDRIFCCHGLDHCLDVARIAYIIGKEEEINVDRELIYAAALLHDVGRADPEQTGREHHVLSVEYAADILEQCGFTSREQEVICDAIGSHNTDGRERTGLANLLYRADKLSRNCFDCQAADQCYWPDAERNKGIRY
ncbi:MAG: HD domain-containing protein [Clostridiales bacterium]|nr:HD domain-containing protein [Clostridiales bacterium]